MTIGIAAAFFLDGQPAIITASDRMLTADDVSQQYEHPAPKQYTLAPNVVVLIAGNLTLHTKYRRRAWAEITKRRLRTTDEIAAGLCSNCTKPKIPSNFQGGR